MRHRGWLVLGALALALTGCGEAPTGAPAATAPAAASAPGMALPAATDEAGLRAAASRALAEQRLYAPAGDNAIEHYLAVRALAPADAGVETALLELLPYAVIGSEQAIARGNFEEAQRLLALVQRTDEALPALVRLRDQLAAAQVEAALAAERAVREAEDAARREQAERLAAATAPAAPLASVEASSTPGASSGPAASVPSPATVAPAPSPAAPTASTAAPPVAPRPAATPLPQLLSAPQPRYPPLALRRKLEGDVVLELRIEADGRVGAARVLSANPPGLFDDAAVAAASRWRFEAGAAAVTTRQVVRFRLPKQD